MFGVHQRIKPYIIRKDAQEMENRPRNISRAPSTGGVPPVYLLASSAASAWPPCPHGDGPQYPAPCPHAGLPVQHGLPRRRGGERKDLRRNATGSSAAIMPRVFPCLPQGSGPARAIQLLKRDLVSEYLHLGKGHACAKTHPLPPNTERKPKIEAPPLQRARRTKEKERCKA